MAVVAYAETLKACVSYVSRFIQLLNKQRSHAWTRVR